MRSHWSTVSTVAHFPASPNRTWTMLNPQTRICPLFSPPPFSLLAQETKVPRAHHRSQIVPSSTQSSRAFKGNSRSWSLSLLHWKDLVTVHWTQQMEQNLISPGPLGSISFSGPLCLQWGTGKPWLSARPPPAYHLPQRSGREGKWNTNEFRAKLNLEVLQTAWKRETGLQRISLGGKGGCKQPGSASHWPILDNHMQEWPRSTSCP